MAKMKSLSEIVDKLNKDNAPPGGWDTLPLSKKEATDILFTLREWLEVGIYGFVEDLDNNKAGLTEERYNAIVGRLERFLGEIKT